MWNATTLDDDHLLMKHSHLKTNFKCGKSLFFFLLRLISGNIDTFKTASFQSLFMLFICKYLIFVTSV